MRLRSFQGLVPAPDQAAAVAAVPYDVVNREESKALAAGNPVNLLHVDRAEIDLPDAVDPYDARVYAKAVENFRRLQRDGVLVREAAPAMYLYRQIMGNHAQTGLVAVCHIEDYENDIIRKHEKTRKVKEDDRTRLVDALSANTGPIFLTYRDHAGVLALTQRAREPTTRRFTTSPRPTASGTRSGACPRTPAPGSPRSSRSEIPLAYVADGHHRSASAARVGKERREQNPHHTARRTTTGSSACSSPRASSRSCPTTASCAISTGATRGTIPASRLSRIFKVTPDGRKEPAQRRPVRHVSRATSGISSTGSRPRALRPWRRSMSRSFSRACWAPCSASTIRAPASASTSSAASAACAELEKLVNSGKFAVAFSMYPTTVTQLMAIADAGQIMPPKSTWFEPKLRSGLFIHTLD